MSGGLLGESKCEGKEVGFTFPSAGAPELLPFLPPVLRYGESEGLLSQVFKSAEAMGIEGEWNGMDVVCRVFALNRWCELQYIVVML